MTLITPEQLMKIAPTLSAPRAGTMTALLNSVCPRYGIDTLDKFHEFLAQLLHESWEFSKKIENMNYSAKRLAQVWPHRFAVPGTTQPNALALSLANKPEALGNYVYGGRMGNKKPGDGYLNRGRGFIGLTGQSMFEAYAKYLNMPVDQVRELVGTDDKYALDSACWFFAVHKKLIDEAERDDFVAVSVGVNGGKIGLADRKKYNDRIAKILNL